MKKYAKYIFIAAALVGVFVFMKACEKREFDQKVEKLKEENAKAAGRLELLEKDSIRLENLRKQDKKRYDSTAAAYRNRISSLQKKLEVISLTKASPQELDSVRLVIHPSTNDTTYCQPIDAARASMEAALKLPIMEKQLEVAGSRVVELETEIKKQEERHNEQMKVSARQLEEERGINGRLNTVIDAQRKHQKKTAVADFFIKVGLTAGAFLAGAAISN